MPPPSAPTGSNPQLGPVTLPLFKLSHCTISGPGARMLWTHLPNRDDMFAVFDQVRSTDLGGAVISKQVLKLIRGGELLETVDFDSLKHQARLDQQRAQSQSVPDELLYVIIVTKRPLLALRYRLPDGQIRRLQMNFQPPSGCDTALDILKPLGLPLRVKNGTEPPQASIQRPYSAQSAVTVASSHSQESKSTLLDPSQAKPTIAQASPVRYTPSSQNDPDVFSKPISYIQDPRAQRPQPGSSNGSSVQYNPVSRPTSSSTGLGLTDEKRMGPPALRRLLPSPTFSNQSAYLGGYENRPISAPEPPSSDFLADTVSFSQLLPPVRELPFPKKLSNQASNATPASSTGPPLDHQADKQVPKPKKMRAPARSEPRVLRSTSNVSSSAPKARAKRATAVKAGFSRAPLSTAPPKDQTAMPAFYNEEPSSSAPPRMNSTLEALEQTVSKMSKNFTPPPSRNGTETSNKRPLSAIDDNETNKRQATIANQDFEPATAQQVSPPSNPVLANINPSEILDSLDGWIRKYHDLPVPVPVPKPPMIAKDQLAEYASKSDEERAKIIDNMICECLRDENFGKLVDDVEGHWKRICLGF